MTAHPPQPEAPTPDAAEALRELLALTLALSSEGAEPESLLSLLDRRAAALLRLDSMRPVDSSARAIQPLLAEIAAAEKRALAVLQARRDDVAAELDSLRTSSAAARAYASPSAPPGAPRFQDRDA